MTTYNTGNPIGSTAVKDLYDNAENLDTAVNDTSRDTWSDRLGRSRKTMSGMEREFSASQIDKQNRFNDFIASSGYQFLGDYAAGIEITEYNQIIRDSDGEFWRLSGQVELPYTTTGAGLPEDDSLTPLGDAVLRQELSNQNQGAALVARGVVAVDSIADLLALPAEQRREDLRYLVKGYHAGSGVGGGEFYWDANSTETVDEGTVFSGPTQQGRWKRILKGWLFAEDFGCVNGEPCSEKFEKASLAAGIQGLVFSSNLTDLVLEKETTLRCASFDFSPIEIKIPFNFPDGVFLKYEPHTSLSAGGSQAIPVTGEVKIYGNRDNQQNEVVAFQSSRRQRGIDDIKLFFNNCDVGLEVKATEKCRFFIKAYFTNLVVREVLDPDFYNTTPDSNHYEISGGQNRQYIYQGEGDITSSVNFNVEQISPDSTTPGVVLKGRLCILRGVIRGNASGNPAVEIDNLSAVVQFDNLHLHGFTMGSSIPCIRVINARQVNGNVVIDSADSSGVELIRVDRGGFLTVQIRALTGEYALKLGDENNVCDRMDVRTTSDRSLTEKGWWIKNASDTRLTVTGDASITKLTLGVHRNLYVEVPERTMELLQVIDEDGLLDTRTLRIVCPFSVTGGSILGMANPIDGMEHFRRNEQWRYLSGAWRRAVYELP